jgi:hypothetical protein
MSGALISTLLQQGDRERPTRNRITVSTVFISHSNGSARNRNLSHLAKRGANEKADWPVTELFSHSLSGRSLF